jgi:gustatory receptor
MLPVDNVLSDDENQLRFQWKSLKTIYSMIFLFCGTVENCLGTRRLLRLGFNIQYVEGLVFFMLASVRGFMFFHLARNWKEIIKMWNRNESVFLQLPYKVKSWSLKSKLRMTFIVFIILTISKWI